VNLFKLLPQVRCVLALQVYLPLKLVGALDLKIELLPHLAELVVNDSQDVRGVRKLDRVAHAHRQGPLHLQGHAHRSHRVAPLAPRAPVSPRLSLAISSLSISPDPEGVLDCVTMRRRE